MPPVGAVPSVTGQALPTAETVAVASTGAVVAVPGETTWR